MKKHTSNIFAISTPSQMMNAMEFIHHFSIQKEHNLVIITCNSKKFIKQIKEIGSPFKLVFYVLFFRQLAFIKPQLFNVMPLKLVRLYVSKQRLYRKLKAESFDRLILGNYSNFISQYCTQLVKTETFLLDDGTGTIMVAKKRIGELKDGIPIFDFNFKKKALWMVKLLMGFYSYKISSKFTFFSSYKLDILDQDQYITNEYKYLKNVYDYQYIDSKLVYFLGSPISEVGYVTQDVEVDMILNYANQHKDSELVYIPHRLDSKRKISQIEASIKVLHFELPIEFVLTQNTALPKKMSGFFTSALPNLAQIMNENVLFSALRIPNHFFRTENMKNRATQVYETFNTIDRIEVINHNSFEGNN